MASDRARAARGAVAGAVAAGVWALQQPLDQQVFGVHYSDAELLGKAVTRRPAWRPIGLAMHLGNGAALGALYAVAVRRVRLPGSPAARGAAFALAEHLATWPLMGPVERHHPARDELPPLAGSARAFAQAAWRHLLFGVVLGEVEHRLRGPEPGEPDDVANVASTNGHGNIEHAVIGTS